MPADFLSDEQVERYRRFRGEVTVGGLERFFRLDAKARGVADKRRPATKPGWAVQWDTVRMLGTKRSGRAGVHRGAGVNFG